MNSLRADPRTYTSLQPSPRIRTPGQPVASQRPETDTTRRVVEAYGPFILASVPHVSLAWPLRRLSVRAYLVERHIQQELLLIRIDSCFTKVARADPCHNSRKTISMVPPTLEWHVVSPASKLLRRESVLIGTSSECAIKLRNGEDDALRRSG